MSQKYKPFLRSVKSFLNSEGIGSYLITQRDGTSRLGVLRVADVILMCQKLRAIVKARQVQATFDYMTGKINGDMFLSVMRHEFYRGTRKGMIPKTGRRFPLTKPEARAMALLVSTRTGASANRAAFIRKLSILFTQLPEEFENEDLMKSFSVQRPRATKIGKLLVGLNVVTASWTRSPHRRSRYVYHKLVDSFHAPGEAQVGCRQETDCLKNSLKVHG